MKPRLYLKLALNRQLLLMAVGISAGVFSPAFVELSKGIGGVAFLVYAALAAWTFVASQRMAVWTRGFLRVLPRKQRLIAPENAVALAFGGAFSAGSLATDSSIQSAPLMAAAALVWLTTLLRAATATRRFQLHLYSLSGLALSWGTWLVRDAALDAASSAPWWLAAGSAVSAVVGEIALGRLLRRNWETALRETGEPIAAIGPGDAAQARLESQPPSVYLRAGTNFIARPESRRDRVLNVAGASQSLVSGIRHPLRLFGLMCLIVICAQLLMRLMLVAMQINPDSASVGSHVATVISVLVVLLMPISSRHRTQLAKTVGRRELTRILVGLETRYLAIGALAILVAINASEVLLALIDGRMPSPNSLHAGIRVCLFVLALMPPLVILISHSGRGRTKSDHNFTRPETLILLPLFMALIALGEAALSDLQDEVSLLSLIGIEAAVFAVLALLGYGLILQWARHRLARIDLA